MRTWPRPFEAGIASLLDARGSKVVLLASGDPFWFGAGTTLTARLAREEWIAHPAPSTFALAAARLGWPIERTACVAVHAAPLDRLRPHLAPGAAVIALVRDGDAARDLAQRVTAWGFGASALWVLEALGGPRERIRRTRAEALSSEPITHPVAVALMVAGDGPSLPHAGGIPDDWFDHDGQISKRPVRALTMSALAPRPHETLWDIGCGSGSIAIEWLLAHPTTRAIGFERDAVRAARARGNALRLGVDRLELVVGAAPAILAGQSRPDAIFVGGGVSEALIAQLPAGARIVANAVTLESEAMLARLHATRGGTLMRVALSEARPLGTRHGWKASYPIVQWNGTL